MNHLIQDFISKFNEHYRHMNKYLLLFTSLFLFSSVRSQDNNLLGSKYSLEQLKAIIIPQNEWIPFPHISDREGWNRADKSAMKLLVKKASAYINYNWPSIPATTSLLIERTGERAAYEKISFEKRHVLGTLLLAEIYENKGRFLDPIINGIWSICEESFWGASAHLPRTPENAGLMDVSKPFVDLFSAETATYLAWIDYFLGKQLDKVSPQIRRRISYEVTNRIFTPLMTVPHGWMKANANGRPPNNWNPWICSNWLNTALLLEKDETKRVNMVYKILQVLDQFLNPYPEDGGCDEGPGYWGAAAASLYDNIALLNLASHNAFQYMFADEKVKNMARYIYRAQISKDYFIDFADADPKPKMAAGMIYRFGKDIGDTSMMQFGAFYRDDQSKEWSSFHFFRIFFEVFMRGELREAKQSFPLPADVWLPGIQVMIARDKEKTYKGFFLAAKGGNNDESHNHNDVGSYIVYYDGLPVIIDVGRGTYTKKTFSDKRYDIWYNCSDYHNLPTINGHTQPPGFKYRASDVSYQKGPKSSSISMNIATAYPAKAGIQQWQRTIRLNRTKNVEIINKIFMPKEGRFTEHMMTCYPVSKKKDGEVVIHYKTETGGDKNIVVRYDPALMQVDIEKLSLTAMEDKGVLDKWGDTIHRINFSGKTTGRSTIKFIVEVD